MKQRNDLTHQIAASLDLPRPLSPFAAQLMTGIEALGSFPAATVSLCRTAGIGRSSAVLDLACGKGAIANAVAAEIGCRVTAVDASLEFIAAAKAGAALRGARVRYLVADVYKYSPRSKFDAVIMLNLFPLEQAAKVCRKLVKSGGVYLIDDAALARGTKSGKWPSPAELRDILEETGDRVISVRQIPAAVVGRSARAIEKMVAHNGRDLVKQYPRLRERVHAYLARLKESRALLTGPLRPTLFAVRAK